MSALRNPTGNIRIRLTRQKISLFQQNNAVHFELCGSEYMQDGAYEDIGTLLHLLKTHSLKDILIDVNKVKQVRDHLDDMKMVGYSGQWMEGLYEHLQFAETAMELQQTLWELNQKFKKSMSILPKQKVVLRCMKDATIELVQEKEKVEIELNRWDMKYEVRGKYSLVA